MKRLSDDIHYAFSFRAWNSNLGSRVTGILLSRVGPTSHLSRYLSRAGLNKAGRGSLRCVTFTESCGRRASNITSISIYSLSPHTPVVRPKRPQQLGPYYSNFGKVSGIPAQQSLLTSPSGLLNQHTGIPFATLNLQKFSRITVSHQCSCMRGALQSSPRTRSVHSASSTSLTPT